MMLILTYRTGLNTLYVLFFHHDISCKVSDNFIIVLTFSLLNFRDLFLSFNMDLRYSDSS